MKNLKVDLKDKFEYGKKGETVVANYVEVLPPSNLVIRHVSILDKELNKAIFNFSRNRGPEQSDPQDTESNVSGEEMIMALMGGGGNIEKCFDALKRILTLNCTIDGEVKFTAPMFDKMSYRDTKTILGEYLHFFLASSLSN